LARETKNAGGTLAGIPNRKMKRLYHSYLTSLGRRAKRVCFGHVLVAVRQGQRRDTAATGEEQLGRCAAGQIKYNEPWAPCKALWVWAGEVIFALATCSLQFAEASAATLLQQEKNNSADVQRGRLNISKFICVVVS
jgi:hypothetical protein